MSKPAQKLALNWEKRLSNAVKAEMLASTFHLLTDHMPKIWSKVPKWLRSQIRQTMFDCGVDYRDFTQEDRKLCKKYSQWLDQQHPRPKSKKTKIDNEAELKSFLCFLYDKESSGR